MTSRLPMKPVDLTVRFAGLRLINPVIEPGILWHRDAVPLLVEDVTRQSERPLGVLDGGLDGRRVEDDDIHLLLPE